jgi:hypothetical protein
MQWSLFHCDSFNLYNKLLHYMKSNSVQFFFLGHPVVTRIFVMTHITHCGEKLGITQTCSTPSRKSLFPTSVHLTPGKWHIVKYRVIITRGSATRIACARHVVNNLLTVLDIMVLLTLSCLCFMLAILRQQSPFFNVFVRYVNNLSKKFQNLFYFLIT